MRRGRIFFSWLLVCGFFTASAVWGEEPSSGSLRVCVAEVNNQTGESLFVERLTERLVRNLRTDRILPQGMDSRTTSERELRPTLQNSEEIKQRTCDYLVLTQVNDPKLHPTELRGPQISIGGRQPRTDAADSSGTARDNLDVNYAVFRPGSLKPTATGLLVDQPSGNVSDSMMEAMDREANRILHELKKKK